MNSFEKILYHFLLVFMFLIFLHAILYASIAYSEPFEGALQLQTEVELALGTKVIVTGAQRSSKRQAELIQKKIDAGVNLYSLYKNHKIVDSIMKDRYNYPIELIIEYHMSKGEYLSAHLCGKAIDLRSRHMSPLEVDAALAKLNSIDGLQAIYEARPPHIHVERTEGCK